MNTGFQVCHILGMHPTGSSTTEGDKMTLKSRILKLEAAMLPKPERERMTIFLTAPNFEPTRCSCNGVEIPREPGESIEAFQKRCNETVSWPEGVFIRIFAMMTDGNDSCVNEYGLIDRD